MPHQLADWPTDDLRIVTSESFEDEDGQFLYAVYSVSMDALMFVGADEVQALRGRGVVEVEALP